MSLEAPAPAEAPGFDGPNEPLGFGTVADEVEAFLESFLEKEALLTSQVNTTEPLAEYLARQSPESFIGDLPTRPIIDADPTASPTPSMTPDPNGSSYADSWSNDAD
ncbi:MAG TPA: hypothetical protein VK694_05885 [Verrucomicrobiae bacterium]|nr:hypothetical protein [Verrucomicrobiae bacterium]